MSSLRPIATTVTWGAGGSTKERSVDLAGFTQAEHGIDTVLHLTCTNLVPGLLDTTLRVGTRQKRFLDCVYIYIQPVYRITIDLLE